MHRNLTINKDDKIKVLNALTAVGTLMTLIDFTVSNVRRFYSSIGNPLAVKGLKVSKVFLLEQHCKDSHI